MGLPAGAFVILLLVSDRDQQREALQRALSIWGACQAFAPTEAEAVAAAQARLVVVDLDLSKRAAIAAAKLALATHRRAGTPCLFLLRDMAPRHQVQANALGAKQILPCETPQAALIDAIGRMLGTLDETGPAAAVQRRFVDASVATTEILEAAANGRPLPLEAISRSVESLNRAADSGNLETWLDMVWQHDDATYQHCLLVSGLVAAFAQRLGFRESDRQQVTSAAVLHDVGKARIPIEILRKEGPLTPDEMAVMRRHPEIGHEMLVAQGGFAPLTLAAVLSHHELMDGSGYPHGIGADRLPDLIRMVTICDIYAALIERRSYKPPMPPEQAFAILTGMGGKLDRDLVRVFGEMVLGASVRQLAKATGQPASRTGQAA